MITPKLTRDAIARALIAAVQHDPGAEGAAHLLVEHLLHLQRQPSVFPPTFAQAGMSAAAIVAAVMLDLSQSQQQEFALAIERMIENAVTII